VVHFISSNFFFPRAMETVINQHGLDIEALKLSRLPLTGGNQIGDSASAQFPGKLLLLVKLGLMLKIA
jgi:hypothetical protein